MDISRPGARRRPAERRAPRLVALPPPSPKSEITVPQALQAVEDVNSELSPQTHAALKAVIGALVSLTGELQDAREDRDRLKAHIDRLEYRVDTLATSETPALDRTRTGRPWTAEEDRRLIELAAQGLQISHVSKHLDRSYWTVWRRSRLLGLTRRDNTDARARARDLSRIHDRLSEVFKALLERVA
jgi:hypothetical protein